MCRVGGVVPNGYLGLTYLCEVVCEEYTLRLCRSRQVCIVLCETTPDRVSPRYVACTWGFVKGASPIGKNISIGMFPMHICFNVLGHPRYMLKLTINYF